MENNKMLNYIKAVLENMLAGWLNLTTHRLDIYDEKLAKTQFIEQFENLFNDTNSVPIAIGTALNELRTAYDYIRLGHPLSCIPAVSCLWWRLFFIMGGAQLITIGINGGYLGRTFSESKQRLLYLIKKYQQSASGKDSNQSTE